MTRYAARRAITSVVAKGRANVLPNVGIQNGVTQDHFQPKVPVTELRRSRFRWRPFQRC